MDYLGHQVFLSGLEVHPKDLGSLGNIPCPLTLRSMQSFLESLNCYSRFIEDFAIYASVPYELREADLHEIRRMEKMGSPIPHGKRVDDRKCRGDRDPDRIGIIRGDRKADDQKYQGDRDPDSIGISGGDTKSGRSQRSRLQRFRLFLCNWERSKTGRSQRSR